MTRRADPRVLVGHDTHDDAGVFQLTPSMALVQTVDFFTPVVDDPKLFGQVAATNALSDIYAMGATPLTALNLLAAPADRLAPEAIRQMLEGGQTVMDEHHTAVLGGHSIDDPEPKMGYAVTGIVDPARVWRNSTAQPGQRVYLTKPIGTGVLIKAIKDGIAEPEAAQACVAMMTQSNRGAYEAIRAAIGDPGACTDVTGFGLLGHLWEMAQAAGVAMEVWSQAVPVLPGARALAEAGRFPAGSRRNWDYVAPHVLERTGAPWQWQLLADAVTSGGLLFTAHPQAEGALQQAFQRQQVGLYPIGQVMDGAPGLRVL